MFIYEEDSIKPLLYKLKSNLKLLTTKQKILLKKYKYIVNFTEKKESVITEYIILTNDLIGIDQLYNIEDAEIKIYTNKEHINYITNQIYNKQTKKYKYSIIIVAKNIYEFVNQIVNYNEVII